MQTLYVLQGGPGSSKSYLAKLIKHSLNCENIICKICSTDYYFEQDGLFDAKKLGEYHAKNLERAKKLLNNKITTVIDNTNTYAWECREYVKHAHSLGVPVVFIRVTGNFKNTHGVPEAKVAEMKQRMQKLDLETVLNSKSPWDKS